MNRSSMRRTKTESFLQIAGRLAGLRQALCISGTGATGERTVAQWERSLAEEFNGTEYRVEYLS
ncbi:MAG: hypothetical protein MN733_13890 [Nitrososphaera sp.]|nr:hypothetical protein [Nitrososphaera sp.]